MAFLRTADRDVALAALSEEPDLVVCVPVFEEYAQVENCLNALVAHTPERIPILIVDDCSQDPRMRTFSIYAVNPIVLLHRSENLGFVANVNDAFALAPVSDMVLVNSDVIVGPNWLERLRDAAYSLRGVATATPLANDGSFLSVPNRNRPSSVLPSGLSPNQAAMLVAASSRRLRPLIPTAVGHCTFFRRSALEVVGCLDETFSPGFGGLIDFSQRAVAMGLVHVCADDVFVFRADSASSRRVDTSESVIARNGELIAYRYPYYSDWIEETERESISSLAAALEVAGAALDGLRVIVDGFCLGPTTMGTQVLVTETTRALARHPAVSEVIIFVHGSIAPGTLAALSDSGIQVVKTAGPENSLGSYPDAHLVYRPYQVNRLVELEWLLAAAPRMVVTQLDCIAFNNPAYFEDYATWSEYRRVIRLSFEMSDGHTFISNTAVLEARQSGLVKAHSEHAVTYPGSDTRVSAPANVGPGGLDPGLRGYLLCLGSSYKHKNRLLAIRVLEAARALGWDGDLVLAGPTPPDGSSLADEDVYLSHRIQLAAHIWRVGDVSDEEKEWLYERAALVLYPTLAEGFGLVPFEAATREVPCLSTRAGALDEILPRDIPTIDPADVEAAARKAVDLVNDEVQSKALCMKLKERGADFTWDKTASSLVEFFWQVLSDPRTPRRALPDISLTAGDRIGETAGDRIGEEVGTGRSDRLHPRMRWVVRQVDERPGLRGIVVPPDSRRRRLGGRLVQLFGGRAP